MYFNLGTGQYQTEETRRITNVDQRIWPLAIKKIFSSSTSNRQNSTMNRVTTDEQHEMYKNRIQEYLNELNAIIEQLQDEFVQKKTRFIDDYSMDLDKILEDFVYQYGIRPFQMKMEYKLTLLKYEYDAELLEREYVRLKPTEYQVTYI